MGENFFLIFDFILLTRKRNNKIPLIRFTFVVLEAKSIRYHYKRAQLNVSFELLYTFSLCVLNDTEHILRKQSSARMTLAT